MGRIGEIKTAEVIDPLCLRLGGPTVLHDVIIPIPDLQVNVDHLIIITNHILLLDAKNWRPGTYVTKRDGTARIDGVKSEHVSKQTMQMARNYLERYLAKQGLAAKFETPIIVVWPSSQHGTINLRRLSVPGATVMHSDDFVRKSRRIISCKPADPRLVTALVPLVKKSGKPKPPPAPRTVRPDDDWSM